MKKTLIWVVMLGILSAYTATVATHHDTEAVAIANAATHHERLEARRQTVFQRLIERLTFRQEEAERQCEERDWPRNMGPCKKASVFSRLILVFSAHVS